MNRQEIFSKAYAYAKTMRGPSYFMESDKHPTCAYRGCNGGKCLIGALIPDNLYSKDMERNVIESLLQEFPDLDDYFEIKDEDDVTFLGVLQSCHDYACEWNSRFAPDKIPVEVFKEQLMVELKDFAETHGLNCE